MSEELNVGSVAVSVVPDATGFDEKLQAEIRNVTAKVRLVLEDAAAKAGIAETAKDRTTKVGVRVEGADRAAADIDRVARDRTATIKVKADTKEAQAQIGALKLLAVPALSLGAPLVGSALGTGLGLGSVLGPAAGGLGLFGLIAKRGISQTNQDSKTLATMQNAVQTARTAAARQAALRAYTKQYNSESPTQLSYINSERALSKQVNAFATSPEVFKPVSVAMKLMADVLPKLEPVIKAVGESLTKALTSVDKAVGSGAFDKFINGFARLAGSSLDKILPGLGNFVKGFVELEGAMSGTGLSFLDKFAKSGKSFADWGANGGTPGFKKFVSYMQAEIPKVHQTLKDLGGALVDVFKALSPIGDVTLTVVGAFAKLVEQIAGLGKFGQLAIEGAGLLFFLSKVKGLVDNVTASAGKMGARLSGVGATMVQESGYHGMGYNDTVQGARGFAGNTISSVGARLQSKYGMAAGLGGAVLGVVSAESNNKAVNVLGGAASGALMGFAAGGPWGAALGGAAGALIPLISNLWKTHDAAKQAAADISFYAGTLTASGNANTDAAKQRFVSTLTPKELSAAKAAGVTANLGSAGVGLDNGATRAALNAQRAKIQAELAGSAAKFGMNGNAAEYISNGGTATTAQEKAYAAYLADLKATQAAIDTLNAKIAQGTIDMRAQQEQMWANTQQTARFHDAIKGLPAGVVTQIEASNVTPTTEQVIGLFRKYNDLKDIGKIQTVLAAMGTDLSIKQIQALIDRIKKVPPTVPVVVTADVRAAVTAIQNVVGAFLPPIVVTGAPKSKTPPAKVAKALGGYITGPGTGTSDQIPAWLSNGEFVMNARATAKHRRLLESLNAQHFAAGGAVLTPGQVAGLPGSVTGGGRRKGRKGRRGRTSGARGSHGLGPLVGLQLRQAQHAFGLQEGMSDKAVRDRFFNFLILLEKHGGHVTTAFTRLEKAALANEHQWTKVNDKLKAVQARMASDQSAAAGSFMGNIFAGSADFTRLQLGSDVKNETAMIAAVTAARKKGLSGEFGAQLTGSGNLALAQQFSVMSPAMLKQIQALYAQREAGSTALGNVAASFDQAEAKQYTKELSAIAKQLAAISGRASSPVDDRLQRDANATITRGVIRVQTVGHTNLPVR